MNGGEKVVFDILKKNVELNNKNVPVIVKSRYYDATPCITIETLASSYSSPRYNEDILLRLPSTHPQYDANDPTKKFAQEVVTQEEDIKLLINIWANTEEQRQPITNQVKQLLNQALNFHYSTCSNFNSATKNCSTINSTCMSIDNIYSRGMKGMCPDPKTLKYESIFKSHNIKHGSFNFYTQFNQDELNLTPPVLRTILKIELTYYDRYVRGGNETTNIDLSPDIT